MTHLSLPREHRRQWARLVAAFDHRPRSRLLPYERRTYRERVAALRGLNLQARMVWQ